MKFQIPIFKFFLNGRTHGRTDGRTSRKQYAPHFFKVGGIIIVKMQKKKSGMSGGVGSGGGGGRVGVDINQELKLL